MVDFKVLMGWAIGTARPGSEPRGQKNWYELKGKKKRIVNQLLNLILGAPRKCFIKNLVGTYLGM